MRILKTPVERGEPLLELGRGGDEVDLDDRLAAERVGALRTRIR